MNEILLNLSKIIKIRKKSRSKESYTSSLLHSGIEQCSKKFGEEAFELVIAALNEDLERFNNEAADVLYHLLVLIEAKDADLNDILALLSQRQKMSGHAEKASR